MRTILPMPACPEEKIWDEINTGWSRMSFRQRHLWEAIKRPPEEWTLSSYGPCWVVAIIGATVVYYNSYEGGFDLSPWTRYGVIDAYQGLQYDLAGAVERLQTMIESGVEAGPHGSRPSAREFQPRRDR
ncbi:hypothetical protein [Rhizobium sp. FKL33]|uniref:hypothetical protein n=1 Tax=Rhizobium sp. FKL33 TaxID=2562307 RepID=UPI001FEE2199|nr:hypothetical protein [Rhizobium sp. FKL33]